MKKLILIFSAAFSCCAASSGIDVYFSPKGGCADAVVREIGKATNSVDMQAYMLTSPKIIGALVSAMTNRVSVRVILDRSQNPFVKAKFLHESARQILADAKVPTWIDGRHVIAHNKVIIIDGRKVITGSFNFTVAADTSNAENLLVIDDASIASKYKENWKNHMLHSVQN